jgi:hypothetical protein
MRRAGLFPASCMAVNYLRSGAGIFRAKYQGMGPRPPSRRDVAVERERLTVLHYDRDFEHIAKVTGQSHQWIVPAGSVD